MVSYFFLSGLKLSVQLYYRWAHTGKAWCEPGLAFCSLRSQTMNLEEIALLSWGTYC